MDNYPGKVSPEIFLGKSFLLPKAGWLSVGCTFACQVIAPGYGPRAYGIPYAYSFFPNITKFFPKAITNSQNHTQGKIKSLPCTNHSPLVIWKSVSIFLLQHHRVISKAIKIPEYLRIELREEWKSSLGQLINPDNMEEFLHTYSPTMTKFFPKAATPQAYMRITLKEIIKLFPAPTNCCQ